MLAFIFFPDRRTRRKLGNAIAEKPDRCVAGQMLKQRNRLPMAAPHSTDKGNRDVPPNTVKGVSDTRLERQFQIPRRDPKRLEPRHKMRKRRKDQIEATKERQGRQRRSNLPNNEPDMLLEFSTLR